MAFGVGSWLRGLVYRTLSLLIPVTCSTSADSHDVAAATTPTPSQKRLASQSDVVQDNTMVTASQQDNTAAVASQQAAKSTQNKRESPTTEGGTDAEEEPQKKKRKTKRGTRAGKQWARTHKAQARQRAARNNARLEAQAVDKELSDEHINQTTVMSNVDKGKGVGNSESEVRVE